MHKVDDYVQEALEDAGSGYFFAQWELKVERGYIKFEIEVENNTSDDIEYTFDFETGELLEKD